MKYLFFTHDFGNYGSGRSLALTIKALKDRQLICNEDIILIGPRSLKNKEADIPTNDILSCCNYFNCILPFSNIFIGSDNSFFVVLKIFVKNFLVFFDFWISCRKYLNCRDLQCVHLNSLTLWPLLLMIPHRMNIVMHIREVIDEKRFPLTSWIAMKIIIWKSSKIIAIDKLSAKPFLLKTEKVKVLKNPFDMSSARLLRNQDYKALCDKYEVDYRKKKIAIIGNVYAIKGQDFFLNAATCLKDVNDLQFIIVGDGTGSYMDEITAKVNMSCNIFHIGFVKEVQEIYAISDIVVRCDSFLPLGRTLWEAYYAGCDVLIPANDDDDISEIVEYIEKGINTYKTRDIKDFCEVLLKMSINVKTFNEYRPDNNIEEFVGEFWASISTLPHNKDEFVC